MPSGPEWIIVLVIVLLVFGGAQLPKLAKNLGKAQKEFKEGKEIAPEERTRRKLVRRSHFMTIVAAWVITVPAAALLSAVIFLMIRAAAG